MVADLNFNCCGNIYSDCARSFLFNLIYHSDSSVRQPLVSFLPFLFIRYCERLVTAKSASSQQQSFHASLNVEENLFLGYAASGASGGKEWKSSKVRE